MTTTSVSGCSTAARRSVVCSGIDQRSANAAPRASERENTTRTWSRPRWPWRVGGVEVADQPGAEHRDVMGLHGGVPPQGWVGLPAPVAERPRTRSRPATSAPSLAVVRWRAVWLNPQSGTRLSRSAGTPVREDRVDPGGNLGRGLDVGALDVDHAGCHVLVGVDDLAQDPDFAHLAVRELEDELVDREAEHGREDRAVRARREGPAEEVAEAQVGTEPHAPDGRLDRRVEEGHEVGGRVRVDGGRRLIDLDDGGARFDEGIEAHRRRSGRTPRRRRRGSGRSRRDRGRAGPTACTGPAA